MSASVEAFLSAMESSVVWHAGVAAMAVLGAATCAAGGVSAIPFLRRKRAGLPVSDAFFAGAFLGSAAVAAGVMLVLSGVLRTPLSVPVATMLSFTGVVAAVGVNLAGTVYDTAVMQRRMSGADSPSDARRRFATYGVVAALVAVLVVVMSTVGPATPAAAAAAARPV
jgi:hypothetical protein